MKIFLASAIAIIFTTSVFAIVENNNENHYFKDFPKNCSKNLYEFCEQGIRYSDYELSIHSKNYNNLYYNGYWQGQNDAYKYFRDIINN